MADKRLTAGDTIVEVVFAVAIFSMVAVGAMMIMNKGLAVAQQSLEVTLVRQQIDAQAEQLRYIHEKTKEVSEYKDLWSRLPVKAASSVKQLVGGNNTDCEAKIQNSFFLYSRGGVIRRGDASFYNNPQTHAKVDFNNAKSYGISVQLVKGNKHYDAYIQACWYGPSGKVPTTIGTIVRLYDSEA